MNVNVFSWLEESCRRCPNKVAIVDEYGEITYKEYYEKSVGIAKKIIEKKIGSKKPIVVFMEKSAKVLCSFMGIVASGNFYSPIDTNMPLQRINKILETLNPKLVITTVKLKDNFNKFNYNGEYIVYNEIEAISYDDSVNNCLKKIIDTDLLYVLFTSGSTGNPKGVCIANRGVIDYINWVTKTFNISEQDKFANQAPFYFDNSILDIYSTMKMGATLYITPKKLFSQPILLMEYLLENEIDTIFWVPSALMVISKLKAFRNVDLNKTLKRVLFCGEVMPNKQLNIWREYLPNALYANLYGPTEITDACTYYIVDRKFSDDESLPIGIPMENTEILVLDEEDKLIVKPGVAGELCVRGTGVAYGYYNNTEKTNEAFVRNPLNGSYEEKIYRTGDIVEYNNRGELMYLSRKDFQIKHMGHRIELGEIETAVSSLDGVTSCCCLYDDKYSRIVLFIDKEMTKEHVRMSLSKMIPEYMIPGKIVCLECFPLNANGKIDRVELKNYI